MSTVTHQQTPANRTRIWGTALLAGLWIVTIATWMYDEDGYTVGMPMPLFFVHLIAPLIVGLMVGRQKLGLGQGVKSGAIAGALFGAANIGAQLIWGAVLSALGRIPPDQPFTFTEGVFEVVEFLILFTIVGLLLGATGGFLGAAFAARARGE